MLFVRNLELNPGEDPSFAVIVRMIDSNNQVAEVFAEDFRAVPDTDLMQVVFRVPGGIATAAPRSSSGRTGGSAMSRRSGSRRRF